MATLEIRRKTSKVWQHVSSDLGNYIVSKMYCKTNGDTFKIIESGGSQRGEYNYSDVTIYDDVTSGSAETFTSALSLMQRLEALSYVGFYYDGDVIPADLISTDASNTLILGSDGKLYSAGGGAVAWGSITGTLSDQTDLQNALDTKQETLVSGTNIKTINGNTILGSGDLVVGGSVRKQVLVWQQGNWSTPTLDRYYYIGYNGNAIEVLPGATSGTTIAQSMTGRNSGIGVAPFDCKIKRLIFKEQASGGYTGTVSLASGEPQYNSIWNIGYINTVVHNELAITADGYHSKYFEVAITDDITVPKGYIISPMLRFSAQVGATKTAVYFAVEIEEVI